PVVLIRAIVPHMIGRGGGTVINITSGAGDGDPPPPPGAGRWARRCRAGAGGWGRGYGASKASLHRIAGILALETAGQGVRVFNVQPGFVVTERMIQDMGAFGFDTSRGARRPPGRDLRGVQVAARVTRRRRAQRPEHRGSRGVRRAGAASRVVAQSV